MSLRGGYFKQESPYKDSSIVGDVTGYSLGLGYRFGNINIDIAYQQREQLTSYQMYNTGLVDRVKLNRQDHNFTITLGCHL